MEERNNVVMVARAACKRKSVLMEEFAPNQIIQSISKLTMSIEIAVASREMDWYGIDSRSEQYEVSLHGLQA